MSFRAIFFDIDGTLLGRDKRMPPSTLHALKKARENGVLLFVATGRVTPMTYFLRDYFDFDGFAAMTGQYCFDKNGKVLHTLAIDPKDIRLLMQLQKEEPFPCLIAEGRECFAATPAKQIEDHFFGIIFPPRPLRYIACRLSRSVSAYGIRPGNLFAVYFVAEACTYHTCCRLLL